MAINFVPGRGLILICDYDLARVHPEMNKSRRVVVVSPRSYNRRHGEGFGRCVVVPFTATEPKVANPALVSISAGRYQSLPRNSWAVCDAVMAVSHARLRRVWTGPGRALNEFLLPQDLRQIEAALRHSMGLVEIEE